MNGHRLRSLSRTLISRLIAFQAAGLIGIVIVLVAALSATGLIVNVETEDETIDILQQAIVRDESGRLQLQATPDLTWLRANVPDRWFIVRDQQGQHLTEGQPPAVFSGIGSALDAIGQARLGWNMGQSSPTQSTARMKWIDSRAGRVQVMTGPGPRVTLRKILLIASMVISSLVVPSLIPLILATLVTTPLVVRNAMAGLDHVAAQARSIDISRLDSRLSLTGVPSEAAPLVQAINDALSRLEAEYGRQQRFLTDASHELRTPIAILQTRLEALADGSVKDRLLEDLARLANLAEQLLDIQRLSQHSTAFVEIDLVDLAKRVAADIAPLAIGAGYELAFESEVDHAFIRGDQLALERALTNLVQNAIQYGGRRGTITITLEGNYTVSVTDEGNGIPAEYSEEIFEPFRRMNSQTQGAGLGLHLVRDIVRRHQGKVSVANVPGRGACFRMTFRPSGTAD